MRNVSSRAGKMQCRIAGPCHNFCASCDICTVTGASCAGCGAAQPRCTGTGHWHCPGRSTSRYGLVAKWDSKQRSEQKNRRNVTGFRVT